MGEAGLTISRRVGYKRCIQFDVAKCEEFNGTKIIFIGQSIRKLLTTVQILKNVFNLVPLRFRFFRTAFHLALAFHAISFRSVAFLLAAFGIDCAQDTRIRCMSTS